MRKSIFLVITLIVATILACGFNVSTANIEDARIAKDPDGNQSTTVFAQDDTFYAVVEVANAPDDTKVKAVWVAVEADGVEPNFVIGEKELVGGGTLKFNVRNSEGQLWPVGTYKVDLYLNDELDRTLKFDVEGQAVAEAPTDTPEPTATLVPTDTPTSEAEPTVTPTEAAKSETSDSIAGDSITEPTEEPAEEPEPLSFQAEPYVHSTGAFSFAVPKGWELISEDEAGATFGDNKSFVGVSFFDAGSKVSDDDLQQALTTFADGFLNGFADSYELAGEDSNPEESVYFAAYTYESTLDGGGDADIFLEQRDTVIYIFYFVSSMYTAMEPTWDAIIDSYSVDPQAAMAAAPTPVATPTPAPPPPTPTPVPATNPFAPQPGRSRLYVFNEYGEEITFTIASQEIRIPPGTPDDAKPIDLDPGKYTFTISIPGGAVNGEVEMGQDQSWAVGVRGDGVVYNPFQVYP